MKRILVFVLVSLTLSCNKKPPEPSELYSKYRKSVVLIQNSYYFKTTLDNGYEFYYTTNSEEPIFHETEEEAINNAGISFGTGFFISDKGELATNRHVVYPSEEDELVGEQINEYFNELKYKVQKAINDNENDKSKLADLYNEYYEYLDYDRRNKIKDEFTDKKNKNLELQQFLDELEFNPSNTKTELKRVFLGIAYDDTFVTSASDFSECVAIKKSDIDNIDLAVIQLKNKTTPENITDTFSVQDVTSLDELQLNDNVYMIGFNHGIELANTGDGIKSQFTQGTITQDPDNNKVLYSIPTLPGSSGSPVIDEWGNLVAVNFAKTRKYQGFSFGIPSIALANLYNNNTNADNVFVNTSVSDNVSDSQETKALVDYSDKIREFLKAEENRDFEYIYTFFSPKFSRYYDITTPSYSKLKNRYEYLWGFTSNSRNYVKSITKINDYTYDLNTEYVYYNHRKNKELSVNSTVRFLFDSDGLIIETYGIND